MSIRRAMRNARKRTAPLQVTPARTERTGERAKACGGACREWSPLLLLAELRRSDAPA